MKVMKCDKGYWGGSINFVDEDNTVVGFELYQSCCEHADWYVAPVPTEYSYKMDEDLNQPLELKGYLFDKDFVIEKEGGDLDDGGMVIFKLTKEGEKDQYLHLFNSHNGYYSHGFIVEHSGQVTLKGSI